MEIDYNDAEMQLHQGMRLKKIISESRYKVKEISELSEVPMSSLYDFFEKTELMPSRIRPILKLLNVSFSYFYSIKIYTNTAKPSDNTEGFVREALQKENELLRQQLADKEEIITLLKARK